jgi:hypothetical protein
VHTAVSSPGIPPGLTGPAIQHLNLRNVPTPGDAERGNLVASFAPVVSLVESAERLQEWGAAPEQRLAIWMRQLPVSFVKQPQPYHIPVTLAQEGAMMMSHVCLLLGCCVTHLCGSQNCPQVRGVSTVTTRACTPAEQSPHNAA